MLSKSSEQIARVLLSVLAHARAGVPFGIRASIGVRVQLTFGSSMYRRAYARMRCPDADEADKVPPAASICARTSLCSAALPFPSEPGPSHPIPSPPGDRQK